MGRNYTKTNLIMRSGVGLLALTMISGLVLTSNKASADSSAVSTTSITVPVACTMRGTGVDSHTATLAPNTYSGASGSEYENGIGKTILTAICNDDNGFAIYAIGYTGNSYDSENHTKLVGTNTGGVIATKAYAAGDTTSNWSMKLTKVTNPVSGDPVTYNPDNLTITTGYDTWHAVPDTFAKVAEYHANTGSSTTDTTLGVKLETTYAAYIATNQPADIYEGQVKYTMVHPYTEEPLQPQPSTAGCINYHANASNAIGTMGCQSATDGNSINLLASNFSRTGYGFAGWSDKFDYATNSEAKFYGPQETITVPTGTTANGLSLYAVWVKSAGNLQDSSKVVELCGTGANSLTTARTDGTANLTSVSALTDQRDNNTYAIAKLADGNCWMIENLRLDNTATLTLANTNNPLNDGTNVNLKHNYSDTDTYNNLSPSQNPATTAWCNTHAASCDDQSMLFTGNTTNRATSPTSNSNSIYSYGNYYNWYSATAGRGTYSFSTKNDSVAGDLCPTGWRLPQGGDKTRIESDDDNDFWNLTVDALNNGTTPANYSSGTTSSYSGTAEAGPVDKKLRSYPNNFVYSGFVDSGSVTTRGSSGDFWSSTANSPYGAYYLYLGSTLVGPGTNNGSKFLGWTVRCVASGV